MQRSAEVRLSAEVLLSAELLLSTEVLLSAKVLCYGWILGTRNESRSSLAHKTAFSGREGGGKKSRGLDGSWRKVAGRGLVTREAQMHSVESIQLVLI